jgi:hypothetical protein
MVQPLAIANLFEIPTFVMFDADGGSPTDDNKKTNLALLRLCALEKANPFPSETFETEQLVMWPRTLGEAVGADIGEDEWAKHCSTVREKRKIGSVPNLGKNSLFISLVLTHAYEAGIKSTILESLCNRIIAFARKARGTTKPVGAARA